MPVRPNIRVAVIAAAVSIALSTMVFAEGGADNTANIKRIGEVNIRGKVAASTQVAPATPTAEVVSSPAPAAVTEVAQVVPAAAAPASEGAALYVAKTCNACHGADGNTTIMPTYPKIGGQSTGYLVAQMKDIKSGARNNAQSAVMKGIVANVSDEEMQTIAEWLATQ